MGDKTDREISEGFDTLEKAQRSCEKLAADLMAELPKKNILPWDGDGVPASVLWM